jgi:hypothetical protein
MTGLLVVGMVPVGSWCWFNKYPTPIGTYIRYGLTHIPRLIIIISISVMYLILFIDFKMKISKSELLQSSSVKSKDSDLIELKARTQAQKQAIMKLLVYPTIYTVLWIPGLMNRLAEATQQSTDILQITTFMQFTTQLIGFANAATYGYNYFMRF